MNNDELKKKIVNEINKCQLFGGRFGYRGELIKFPNELLADALIAAGIGDVKEIKHRMVVAEKALWIKCYESAGIGMPFNCNRDKCELEMGNPCYRECATNCFVKAAIKQAEKQLAEEGKDD